MKEDIKALWIKGLLSGEYTQGRNRLEQNGKFCCLGVLCDIAAKHGIVTRKLNVPRDIVYYDGQKGALPLTVVKWADLPESDPHVAGDRLSAWNDGGTSFAEIADFIREYL